MIIEKITWTELSFFLSERPIDIQFFERAKYYRVWGVEGPFIFVVNVLKTTPANSDQIDFETNYKINGNQVIKTQTSVKSSGVVKVRKKTATTSENTHTVASNQIDFCYIRNIDDTRSIVITFNSTDLDVDFITLKPGQETLTFGVTKGTIIKYKKAPNQPSGVAILEIILWG